MRYAAVVNAAAGAASRLGTDTLTRTLNERLEHNLLSLRYTDGTGLCTACQEAINDKPDALLIVGGDGTCRSAAALAAKKKVPIVLLPGGTMNVLAKRIWGAEPFERVLETIAGRNIEAVQLDMGSVNGNDFIVAAMFGLMPALARIREKFRGASLRQSWNAARELENASGYILKSSVRVTAAELATPRRTSGLVVSMGDADRLLPWRDQEDDFRAFDCIALNLDNWRDAARIAVKTLRHGDWRADAKVDNFTTRQLRVESGRSTWVTLDGEPVKLRGPVDVTYKKNALTIVAPRKASANDNAHRASVRSSLPRG